MSRALSLALALLVTASLAGCDVFGGQDEPEPVTQGVFVANQGNFSDGNGSVTAYDPDAGEATTSALTDFDSILQGITIFGSRLYVNANTGGRVDVFSTENFEQVAQVGGLSGPRYSVLTDRGLGVVTDQSFGSPSYVKFIDFESPTPTVVDSAAVPGLPEGVTLTPTRIYAALGAFSDTTLVAAITRETLDLAETIDVGCAPRLALADTEDDVYVVCSNAPRIVRLDGPSGDQLSTLSLPDTASTLGPGQTASFSPEANELYVALKNNVVVRIDTEAEAVTAEIGPVDGSRGIGAVAYDAVREELYLGRLLPPPDGFTTQGRVTVHDRSGAQVASFPAGVAPTHIAFRRVADE